ncbi:unnamed protein product [Darwinula stevensoni]|uniref:Uncharacterized protein n=1 Tax=Darwinula stevensoni TaxID=69355 RepID=A0A7R9FQA5_9CRUS|nr:unnamed protein product [Darwinula stevensoni]CAG0898828.1 unnamed protein product [Darwinula stevensoni]
MKLMLLLVVMGLIPFPVRSQVKCTEKQCNGSDINRKMDFLGVHGDYSLTVNKTRIIISVNVPFRDIKWEHPIAINCNWSALVEGPQEKNFKIKVEFSSNSTNISAQITTYVGEEITDLFNWVFPRNPRLEYRGCPPSPGNQTPPDEEEGENGGYYPDGSGDPGSNPEGDDHGDGESPL